MTPEELKNLIDSNNIDKVQAAFKTREEDVEKSLQQYRIKDHTIFSDPNRRDKVVKNKKGESKTVKQWKIPIPYQKKIVESAVAFLFGKPVKFVQESEGTDEAFNLLNEVWKEMRMHSMNRETARILFSETEVARLFTTAKNKEGQNRVRCRILAKSLGDTIYTHWDVYGSLQAFAWKYSVKEDGKDVEHFDIYTDEFFYQCVKRNDWEVKKEENKIGKIPVSYYKQDQTEWHDVQDMIERLEWLMSTRADVNDYSANPILILEGQVIDLPEKTEVAKVVQMEPGGKASYLTPQMVIEMVKDERETLEEAIRFCTDTPDTSQKEERMGTHQSGIALIMKFFPAVLKAMNKQELWGEILDREVSILKAIFKSYNPGVTEEVKAARAQIDKLKVGLEFGNPLPDNIAEKIEMLNLAAGAPTMSQKTAMSLNPLVSDADAEYKQYQLEEANKQASITL